MCYGPDDAHAYCHGHVGHHTHGLCPRCGLEWISSGKVPPGMRTPLQAEITIHAAW